MMMHLLAAMLTTGLAVGSTPTPADLELDRAAREFRIQVYETFRQDRPEYDHRLAEWGRVESAWIGSGSPDTERADLIAWLSTATNRSKPITAKSLPESPPFVLGAEFKERIETYWRELVSDKTMEAIVAQTASMGPMDAIVKNASEAAKRGDKMAAAASGETKVGPITLPFQLPIDLAPVLKDAPKSPTTNTPVPTVSVTQPEPTQTTKQSSAQAPSGPADLLQVFGQRLEQGFQDLKAEPAKANPTGSSN